MMDLERETNGMNTLSYSSPWSVHSIDQNQGVQSSLNQLVTLNNPPLVGEKREEDDDENVGTLNTFSNGQRKKRKYVKKSIEKFLKSNAVQKVERNDLKQETGQLSKIQLTPIYNHITEKIDFVLIGGDFFYKFYLSEEERDLFMVLSQNNLNQVDDEDKNSALQLIQHTPAIMNQYKEIVEIQKHHKYILVRMANKIDGLKDFQNLISQLSEASQQLVGGESILHPLIELQKIIKACQVVIQGIAKNYENDTDRLLQKQEKRIKFIEKLIKDKLLSHQLCKSNNNNSNNSKNQNHLQEVFTLGFINIDFVQCIPVLRRVLYSCGFIDVMGLTLEEAVNSFVRQGIKECYDLQTRMRIQQAYIKKVLSHNNDTPIQIDGINLLTFDNISIKCSGEIQLLQIDLPAHLRYNESNINEIFLEQVYMMKLNIPNDVFNQVQLYRQSLKEASSQQISSSLLEQEEFRYSIQSQVFIEKFYQNAEQENLEMDININNNNENPPSNQNSCQQNQSDSKSSSDQQYYDDQSKNSRCKFKLIQ